MGNCCHGLGVSVAGAASQITTVGKMIDKRVQRRRSRIGVGRKRKLVYLSGTSETDEGLMSAPLWI